MWEHNSLAKIGVALIVSIVLDIVWLIFYSSGWFNSVGSKVGSNPNDPVQSSIERMTVVMVFILEVVKLLMLVLIGLIFASEDSDEKQLK